MAQPSTSTSQFDSRVHVGVTEERVIDISNTYFPGYQAGHYPDEDDSWDLRKFKKKLQVKVQKISTRSVEFDLVGVDASIANALRRILIYEVPTVAIENVYEWKNTSSIMLDEVFTHRLRHIALNVDPALLEMKENINDQGTDRNTIIFRLQIECTRNTAAAKDSTDPAVLFHNTEVQARHLQWIPQGEQAEVFAGRPPAPMTPETVLVKLRPGQAMDMWLHAVKGVGRDDTKFIPVSNASYRLLTLILLDDTNPVPPDLATPFQDCFSPGVIKVDPRTKKVSVDQRGVRGETLGRVALRSPDFVKYVKLGRVRDHFIFNVESQGPYKPQRLPLEAILMMKEKITVLKRATEALRIPGEPEGDIHMADP